ncbi:phage tail protein I [Anaerocolumna sp. AGMB13020]|uniref:phage tail protein I n=1 Tax=Anaerocolumna sp. AGMB13020 TaxID=3081750 RepID=UPI002954476A|nr:phage tail protein I [Anaerocolumna sp. AGMB13020]WOO34958.1 phage tail protein I [Anaerocolumna sp. AGMB13020]
MISLHDSYLESVLPNFLKQDKEAKAFCYALDRQVKKLLNRAAVLAIWYDVQNVDESLLDYLAIELRTQYYSVDLEVTVKRQLIANTLIWYQKAGTVAVVDELISTVFGSGKIQEWHSYNGDPHHFKVQTSNPLITSEDIQKFNDIIKNIKRKTAILDTIDIVLTATMKTYYGFKLQTGTVVRLKQEG